MKHRSSILAAAISGTSLLFVMILLHTASIQAAWPGDEAQPLEAHATAIVLMRDEFDGNFGSQYPAIGQNITSNIGYQWERVTLGTIDKMNTLWCMAGGAGGSLPAGVTPYTNNLTTTVTYGPLNTQVLTAELSFSYWISLAEGDGLDWGYSTDGVEFTFVPVPTSTMNAWVNATVNLSDLPGDSSTYIAFRFHSDDSGVALGAFLDNVQVRVQENVHAQIDAPDTVCQGCMVSMSSLSTATSGIQSLTWNLGDGGTSNNSTVNHAYTQPGVYTIWLTATSTLGSQDVVSKQITIDHIAASFVISPNLGSTACLNVPTQFVDASQSGIGQAQAWKWHFSDNNSTAFSSTAWHTFSTLGTWRVTLAVTSTNGCTDATFQDIVVAQPPVVGISYNPSLNIQTGQAVQFSDIGSGSIERRWDFGDGTVVTTTASTVQHTFKMGGSKTVVLTGKNASGCTAVAQVTIPVIGKIYLPVTLKKFATAVVIRENFGVWDVWPYHKKKTLNPDGSVSEEFEVGYIYDTEKTTRTSPDGSCYHIWARDDGDHVFVTGPESQTVFQDFVFEASMRSTIDTYGLVTYGDEYGILISDKPIDPTKPSADQVYTFQIRLVDSVNSPRRWVVKKWKLTDSHTRTATELANGIETAYITYDRKVWNRFRIVRRGTKLEFYASAEEKWTEFKKVFEVTDANLPEKLYVGFYTALRKDYAHPMEFQFDDMYLYYGGEISF